MYLDLAVSLIGCGLAVWFWPHCARPVLAYRRAPALAFWLVAGVSALTVLVQAVLSAVFVAWIAGADMSWIWRPLWWTTVVSGGLWVLVVGLGFFQNYEWLLRATHRRSDRSADD